MNADSAYGSRGGGGGDAAGGSARGERVRGRRQMFSRPPSRALGRHRAALTALERAEILEYPRVYFAGIGAKKVQSKEAGGSDNHGYDDERRLRHAQGRPSRVQVRDHRRARQG